MHPTAARTARLAARLAAAGAALALLVGCGAVIDGHDTWPADEPNIDDVRIAALQPANYPTKAVAPTPVTVGPGVVLEGQRMAGYVVIPTEVDPTMVNVAPLQNLPIAGAPALKRALGAAAPGIAAAHGFIAGFSASRHSGGIRTGKSLLNLVMRFPDAPSAAAAAAELGAADPNAGRSLPDPPPPHHPIAIPRYPSPAIQIDDTTGFGVTVAAYTAHGPYVLVQWVQTLDGPDAATQIVAATLDLQGPRIDQFVPTDQAQLPDLPIDPTGLFAHTLPATQAATGPWEGVYTPAGALQYELDPSKTAPLFSAAGLDLMSQRGTSVYRTKDPNAAAQLVDGFAAIPGPATPIDAPAGMPQAKCFDQGDAHSTDTARYFCMAHADRYMFSAGAAQPDDARQQMAAQYLMLHQW